MGLAVDYVSENEINWNPWIGCHKISDGCTYCRVPGHLYRNTKDFRAPVRKQRAEKRKHKVEKYELSYFVKPGTVINVCTNSDFFIEDADYMRDELWEMIHERSDCLFNITTKRPERIFQCLPSNWLLGWDNVIISICVEDNLSALYRLPLLSRLQEIGIRHIGIALQPMLEDMDIISFIGSGYVDRVTVSGENYLGCLGLARILEMAWVYKIREQCSMFEVAFKFVSTGSRLRLLNGQVIDIKWHDQRGLAKFYKLSLFDDKDIVNIWKSNASEIEKRQNIEAAHKIYCIYEEYLRGKQCEKS